MDFVILAVVAATVIVAVTSRVAPRWNVASPLLLVAIGLAVSFAPFLPDFELEPEIILSVVLPPLLYSSAVNMPGMNFRREFTAISSLAVALVIVSSVLLGLFFHLLWPDLALPWCIALGAILSPTDAVATSIARGVGISQRVTTILEGESLLNDATALVTLRTATAAAAASFSLWHAVGQFLYAVVVAVIIGVVAGIAGIWARSRAKDATVSTVLSFVVPFVASVPTELLHGSGLVAAVVAGIVAGRAKDRVLSADQRVSDRTMWSAVTLVLEGGVFLIMGLEIRSLLHSQHDEAGSLGTPGALVAVAAGTLVLMILIRAAYVLPMVRVLGNKAQRAQAMQPRMEAMEAAISDRDLGKAKKIAAKAQRHPEHPRTFRKRLLQAFTKWREARDGAQEGAEQAAEQRWNVIESRTRRLLGDIDYYVRQPLSWRDGTVMVAAGMRGAVTLAAAQTLPLETPFRSSIILVAFAVAVLSLMLQGGLLAPLVKWVRPTVPDPDELRRQRESLSEALAELDVPRKEDEGPLEYKLRSVVARRDLLLDLEDEGYYDPECTASVIATMDASELGLRLQLEQVDVLVHETAALGPEDPAASRAEHTADEEASAEETRELEED